MIKKCLIALLFVLVLAGCGANLDTVVKLDSDSEKVVVETSVEIDDSDLENVIGGKGAVKKRLKRVYGTKRLLKKILKDF